MIWHNSDLKRAAVLLIELPGDNGTSVTNFSAEIATQLFYGYSLPENTRWFETYIRKGKGTMRIDEVEYEIIAHDINQKYFNAQWKSILLGDFKDMLHDVFGYNEFDDVSKMLPE